MGIIELGSFHPPGVSGARWLAEKWDRDLLSKFSLLVFQTCSGTTALEFVREDARTQAWRVFPFFS